LRRAHLNLVVDGAMGVAFLVTAVTGIVFLLPLSWQAALGLGMPGMLGVPLRAWHWTHDWSGAVAAIGVLVHVALHYRWAVHTTRRWLTTGTRERDHHRTMPETAPRPRAPIAAPRPVPAATVEAESREGDRFTRRGFVTGAAGIAAALVGGVVLVKAASGVSLDRSGGAQQGATWSGSGGAQDGSGQGRSSAGGASQNGASQVRVRVDSASCISCGHCLQTCPVSVFAWDDGGRATARSPDQCILCRRCVQVCPTSAITLAG
jgi:NAD-dependent dihydropyrimidine dehydrogenase PreA subunit